MADNDDVDVSLLLTASIISHCSCVRAMESSLHGVATYPMLAVVCGWKLLKGASLQEFESSAQVC